MQRLIRARRQENLSGIPENVQNGQKPQVFGGETKPQIKYG